METTPKPANTRPLLVPDLRDRDGNPIPAAPTRHRFVRAQPRAGGHAFIFRCAVTGSERVFGFEGPHDCDLDEEVTSLLGRRERGTLAGSGDDR